MWFKSWNWVWKGRGSRLPFKRQHSFQGICETLYQILDKSKFKEIADDKIIVTQKLILYSTDTRFNTSTTQTAFENNVGKGEIARNEQFLLYPQCFLLKQIMVCSFIYTFAIISLFTAELEEPRIGIWGKGLNLVLVGWNVLWKEQKIVVTFQ